MAEQEQAAPEAEQLAEQAGTALAQVDAPAWALERAPIIDALNERQVALLKSKAPTLTHAEIGQALELAWAYKLDPYANEVWFAKSKNGRLLIMVGRDGLRRIAQRNQLEVQGSLVHEKDTFAVEYVPTATDAKAGEWEARGGAPFHRVTHKRTGVGAKARGPIVGAWCQVTERATGRERGYFDAGLEEYDRAGQDAGNPWNRQKSAMMLGAVERQAIRQATPLGGLVAEGEDRVIDDNERAGDLAAGDPLSDLPPAVRDTIVRARRLGHAGLADVATAEMALRGQPPEAVEEWLAHAAAELDGMEPPEAEVVPAAEAEPEEPEVLDGEPVADEPWPLDDRIEQAYADLKLARDEGDEEGAERLAAEIEGMEAERNARDNEGQGTLGEL